MKDGQVAAVKALIDAAPDTVIRGLEAALKSDQSGGAVSIIRDMINAEAVERRACASVLSPLLQLSGAPAHDLTRLNFPAETPRRLWRALKEASRNDVEHAVAAWLGSAWSDSSPPVFDKLCARAAKGLRGGEPAFAPVAALLKDPEGVDRLALLLEIAPLARAALAHLPEWLARTTGAHVAAMRLIYKDATKCGDKAGPLLMEVILGHLAEPCQIMKVVAAIMDTPNERYVAASELASFPERLFDSVDRCIESVRHMDEAQGSRAGVDASNAVSRTLSTVAALESALSLQKDGPWSNRITHQRRALASVVESRFIEVEAALNVALPVQSSRTAAQSQNGMPKLVHPPEARHVARAAALLAFLMESRGSAETGGFGTLRTRAQEAAEGRLDQYTDDLLELRRTDPTPEEAGLIGQYLEAGAGLVAVLRGDKAAGVLRRRAAA